MGETTSIGWTEHTFNAWEGCSRVSPGCLHCYAENRAHRYGHDVWGKGAPRMFRSDANWKTPEKWNRAAEAAGKPALVFACSLADVFEDHDGPMVDPHGKPAPGRSIVAERERLFDLIDRTPWLRWLLLTKRPENVLAMVPSRWLVGEDVPAHVHRWLGAGRPAEHWPANAWVGTTVEDQPRADERVPPLLEIPTPVHFLSGEPLVGPVVLRPEWLEEELQAFGANGATMFPRVDWIIVGGESGNGSKNFRPLNLDHARALRDQALEFEVPFFFKQVGGITSTSGGDELDGVTWKAFPGRYQWELDQLAGWPS